jgi:hypothetical protein
VHLDLVDLFGQGLDLGDRLLVVKHRPRLMVFPLKYDKALPVGYCIPQGDVAARHYIACAMRDAFLGPDHNWKATFASAVKATGVHLDTPPESLLAAIQTEIRIGQNRSSM